MPFNFKNFTIDKFNRDVNDSGNLDVKYENWSAYRKTISAFIGEATKTNPHMKSVVVLGAGNVNDLDLRHLCSIFNSIVLTDADTESINAGIVRQMIIGKEFSKIQIIQSDYTGSQKVGFFEGLERLAKKAAPVGEITLYIEDSFSKMINCSPSGIFADGFDMVISLPIYTQLVYTQIEVFLKILHEYGLYEYSGLNKILSSAYNNMPSLIDNYNDLLISACKSGGSIVMLTDIIEMSKKSGLLRKIKKHMSKGELVEDIMESYIKNNGIELAQIGRNDLLSKTDKLNAIYALWPFNQEKEYLVYGVIAKKS